MSGAARVGLRPDVTLHVAWEDTTPFGGPIGRRLEDTLRDVFAQALGLLAQGADPTGPTMRRTLAETVESSGFAALATVSPAGDGWVVRDEVLTPDPAATRPGGLVFEAGDGTTIEATIPAERWAAVHQLVADLAGPGADPAAIGDPAARALCEALVTRAFTTEAAPAAPVAGDGVTFVGHAAVLVRDGADALLVDPFLRSRSERYPPGYQPLTVAELGPISAVLLTHGHPDHFDVASLLQLPRATPLIVPANPVETVLAPDLAARLTAFGFDDVRVREWGSTERIGDLLVAVLPFFGEQPATGAVLHPEVAMAGNTYVVTTSWGRVATIADGGDDRRGSMAEVARRERADHGPVDILFSGYRGWETAPAELLRSSVGRYALFVPPDRWGERDGLMHDPAGALATASAFGASVLVPYADGGAPWFWEIGLGPRLDDEAFERPGFDLFPERVAEVAAAAGSVVTVEVMRPGERWSPDEGRRPTPGRAWPWGASA